MTRLVSIFVAIVIAVHLSVLLRAQPCGQLYQDKSYDVLAPKKILLHQNRALLEVRTFLWEHWRQQKEAKLIIYRSTKEGMPVTERLTLDCDSARKWSMLVEIFHGQWGVHGSPSASYRIHKLIREQIDRDGIAIRELKNDEVAKPSDYRIGVVNDSNNKTVSY